MTYYVYTLTDPRSALVFYVGKGKGARIDAHEVEARKGVHSRKCDTIREIWAEGCEIAKAVVSRHKEETEAYAAEAALIELIGLEKLTNVAPGGIWKPREKKPKEKKVNVWTAEGVRALAPRLRHALLHMGSHDEELVVLGYNLGFGVKDILRSMCRDIGTEKVEDLLQVTFV